MKGPSRSSASSAPPPPSGVRPWVVWFVALASLGVVVLALRYRPGAARSTAEAPESSTAGRGSGGGGGGSGTGNDRPRFSGGVRWARAAGESARPPEAVVADKAAGFAKSRRDVAAALARKAGGDLSPEVDRFFSMAQSADWGDLKRQYTALAAERFTTNAPKDLVAVWPAVAETFGAMGVARFWPAEELLAYGESVLSALRPGSVYVTGSDSARYIPSLVGDGGTGSQPLVVTRDGLRDPAFLDYLTEMHGERLVLPTAEEVAKAERSRPTDPTRTGGAESAFLQALVEKNPGVGFAVEGTIAPELAPGDVVPLGPVMELRGGGASREAVTAAQAAEAVQYWSATAQRLQAATNLEPGSETRRAYAQMASAQAELFARNNLPAEAEQAYRAAYDLAPGAIEPVTHLAKFLNQQGRGAEALQMVQRFAQAHPDLAASAAEVQRSLTSSTPPAKSR